MELNLEVLSQRLRDRQLSPAKEAKAARIQRDLKEMTTEQWQAFTDFFSPETQEQIVEQQHQIQAGRSRLRGSSHYSRVTWGSTCRRDLRSLLEA